MVKIKLLPLILLIFISSCARLDKLTLHLKKADYDKCKWTFVGGGNKFTVIGDYSFHQGDDFRLRPTESSDGISFQLNTYMPSESYTIYTVKYKKSFITFQDTSDKWRFSNYFKLSKIK